MNFKTDWLYNNENNEYLCHYTKNDTAKEILKNMTLRFGKLCKSNDPFEVIQMTNNEYSRNEEEYLNNILQILCFSEGGIKNIYTGSYVCNENIERSNNFYEFIPLYELFDGHRPPYYIPRMWAQYGENHEGVCFIFDKKKLLDIMHYELDDKGYIFKHEKIIYKDFFKKLYKPTYNNLCNMFEDEESEVGDDDDNIWNIAFCRNLGSNMNNEIDIGEMKESVQSFLECNYKRNYFIKDNDWQNEKEYRLIIWNEINNDNYEEKYIPIGESLIGIVLGLKNVDAELRQLAMEKNGNVMRVAFKQDELGVRFVENPKRKCFFMPL